MMLGGGSFCDLTQDPKIFNWSTSGPEWRVARHGLCLEGPTCLNKECKAYKRMVIINMDAPVILKLGNLFEATKNMFSKK